MTTPDRVTPESMRELAGWHRSEADRICTTLDVEWKDGDQQRVDAMKRHADTANALDYAADTIGELLHTCDGAPITDEYQKVYYVDVDRVRWTYGGHCEYNADAGGATYTRPPTDSEPRGPFPCYSTEAAALAAQQEEQDGGR